MGWLARNFELIGGDYVRDLVKYPSNQDILSKLLQLTSARIESRSLPLRLLLSYNIHLRFHHASITLP